MPRKRASANARAARRSRAKNGQAGSARRYPEKLTLVGVKPLAFVARGVTDGEYQNAWRGLTSDAARLAGVDERVGALEPGKDADFVLWSGDPLNLASRVEAVYVDGELAYSAKTEGGSSR